MHHVIHLYPEGSFKFKFLLVHTDFSRAFCFSETTASDNAEPSSHTKFTQTDINDNETIQSDTLDSQSSRIKGSLGLSGVNHSTDLHAAISAHFVKLLDVLTRNNSFEEYKKSENDSKLTNLMCDWNMRLDTLMDE